MPGKEIAPERVGATVAIEDDVAIEPMGERPEGGAADVRSI